MNGVKKELSIATIRAERLSTSPSKVATVELLPEMPFEAINS
jgi:hypothetical protein